MISIKYKDNWLELSSDAKITIEDNSPGFDNNEDRVSITYPFSCSATSWEKLTKLGMTALEYDQPRGQWISGFEIYADGNLIKSGRMRIHAINKNLNDASQDMVELDFQEYIDVLYDIFKDKKVNELVMDGVRLIEGGTLPTFPDEAYSGTPGQSFYDVAPTQPTTDYANDITINGDDYISFPTIRFEQGLQENTYYKYANYWENGLPGYPMQTFTLGYFGLTADYMNIYTLFNKSIIPCYNYSKVIEHCFSENNLSISGDLIENDLFKKAVLLNNRSILKQRLGRLKANNPSDPYEKDFEGQIIFYTEDTTEINPRNHLIDMTIIDFLRDFQKKFNGHFEVYDTSVIFRYHKTKQLVEISKYVTENANIETNERRGVQIGYIFDKDDVILYPYQNLTHTDYPSFESYQDVGSFSGICYIKDLNGYYTSDGAGNIEYYRRNVMQYKTGDGLKIDLAIPCCDNLKVFYNVSVGGAMSIVPYLGCELSYYLPTIVQYRRQDSLTYKIFAPDGVVDEGSLVQRNLFNFMAFYYGLTTNITAVTFPLAFNSNYIPQPSGTPIKMGDFHFSFNSKYGLIAQFYGDDIKMNDNDKIIFNIEPSYEALHLLKFSNLFFIRNRKYKLVKKSYELPLRDTIVCEMYEIMEK